MRHRLDARLQLVVVDPLAGCGGEAPPATAIGVVALHAPDDRRKLARPQNDTAIVPGDTAFINPSLPEVCTSASLMRLMSALRGPRSFTAMGPLQTGRR